MDLIQEMKTVKASNKMRKLSNTVKGKDTVPSCPWSRVWRTPAWQPATGLWSAPAWSLSFCIMSSLTSGASSSLQIHFSFATHQHHGLLLAGDKHGGPLSSSQLSDYDCDLVRQTGMWPLLLAQDIWVTLFLSSRSYHKNPYVCEYPAVRVNTLGMSNFCSIWPYELHQTRISYLTSNLVHIHGRTHCQTQEVGTKMQNTWSVHGGHSVRGRFCFISS